MAPVRQQSRMCTRSGRRVASPAVLPSWTYEGGRKKEIERLKKDQAKIAEDVLKTHSDPTTDSNSRRILEN